MLERLNYNLDIVLSRRYPEDFYTTRMLSIYIYLEIPSTIYVRCTATSGSNEVC